MADKKSSKKRHEPEDDAERPSLFERLQNLSTPTLFSILVIGSVLIALAVSVLG